MLSSLDVREREGWYGIGIFVFGIGFFLLERCLGEKKESFSMFDMRKKISGFIL